MSDEYPEQYLEGLRLFNAEDFFESHEVLEDLWQETEGTSKKFYQGLIQAAVALLHFGNGNLGGARKVYTSSRKYLEPYAPLYEGLDVTKFLNDMQACFQILLDSKDPFNEEIALEDALVPKIEIPG
jgi:hypothetical protein